MGEDASVKPLKAYLEVDDDGAEQPVRIWVPSLPGFAARGRNEAEALARLESSSRGYVKWLGGEIARTIAHGWNGETKVEEVHHDASQVGNFFGWDLSACTGSDVSDHLGAMRKTRSELERLVRTMPRACQDWVPVPYTPRPPKLIALHIAATEVWYLIQFFDDRRVSEGLALEADLKGTGVFELDSRGWDGSLGSWYRSTDLIGFMKATRSVFERVVTRASREETTEVVTSRAHQSKEQWTMRKVLRRAAWHEREHMLTLRRYLEQFRLETRALARPPTATLDQAKLRRVLSGKTETVQLAVSSIHPKDRPLYANELVKILSDKTNGFDSRRAAADALNFTGDPRIKQFKPVMANVPAGKSKTGISEEKASRLARNAGLPSYAFRNETPEHFVELDSFSISRYPVTNMEYLRFARETGAKPPSWWSGTVVGPSFPPWKANHPVWGVSWDDAVSYGDWISKKSGTTYRLPRESEWEKASQGGAGADYPWGANFVGERCNTAEAKNLGTTPVGLYPSGASRFGLFDMAGNVEEWTNDSPDEENSNLVEKSRFLRTGEYKITKGGGWRDSRYTARCSFKRIRNKGYNLDAGGRIGFRLASED
jgi:formylglycine-generating enzyme required for sulfatase activity